MKVWISEAGRENMKVFASEEAANAWFAENDPEGVAFAYPVIEGQTLTAGTDLASPPHKPRS